MAKKEKGKGNKGWRARVSSAAGTTLFAPPGFKDSYKEWLRDRGHVPLQEGADDPGLTRLENDEWIEDVLSCLPPAQREVMECVASGLTYDEITVKLGKSNQTIRKHLSEACQRLRAELNPDGEFKHQRGRKEA